VSLSKVGRGKKIPAPIKNAEINKKRDHVDCEIYCPIIAYCPFDGQLLTRTNIVVNDYKLDNGDPDYLIRGYCSKCKDYFTVFGG
jgi:hypothetical protein